MDRGCSSTSQSEERPPSGRMMRRQTGWMARLEDVEVAQERQHDHDESYHFNRQVERVRRSHPRSLPHISPLWEGLAKPSAA
jgi:hypothetical protein